MDIRYKLYPYPVLISDTDDFSDSSFSFVAKAHKGIRELDFHFVMDLRNDEMEAMIQKGQAEYLVHIECPQTCYRSTARSEDASFVKRIPEKYLNGKVTLCAFIVAKEEITDYRNSDFNEDYAGTVFSVDRGSILAIGGQYDLNVVKDTEELARVPSIFTICKYAADTDESMKIDIDGHKIVIALSDSSFQNYRILTNMPGLLPVFHAMVIVPALIYVFESLRREGTENYEGLRWYVVIRKTLEKAGITLDEETLNTVASYDLAQKLLDLPVDRALNAIITLGDNEEE